MILLLFKSLLRPNQSPRALHPIRAGVWVLFVRRVVRGLSSPQRNLHVLDAMLAGRHELAQLLGARSHAEFTIKPQVAGSPEAVVEFLHRLSTGLRPQVRDGLAPSSFGICSVARIGASSPIGKGVQ